jgi:hypothetical protein
MAIMLNIHYAHYIYGSSNSSLHSHNLKMSSLLESAPLSLGDANIYLTFIGSSSLGAISISTIHGCGLDFSHWRIRAIREPAMN